VISWLAFCTSTWQSIAPNEVTSAGPFPSPAPNRGYRRADAAALDAIASGSPDRPLTIRVGAE
jgi:hypothetical protein